MLYYGTGRRDILERFPAGKIDGAVRRTIGYAVSTAIYAGVHILSCNFILVMAALVAGTFWGGLISLETGPNGSCYIAFTLERFIFAVFPIM